MFGCTIGRRCHELRIDDAIVIWEVFAKKDRTTPQYVIDACKKRIKDYDAL